MIMVRIKTAIKNNESIPAYKIIEHTPLVIVQMFQLIVRWIYQL